jgi:putative endopeptidase
MLTTVDPHPLPRFRAAGALMNTPEFAQAFDCQAGDKMMKPSNEICKIW